MMAQTWQIPHFMCLPSCQQRGRTSAHSAGVQIQTLKQKGREAQSARQQAEANLASLRDQLTAAQAEAATAASASEQERQQAVQRAQALETELQAAQEAAEQRQRQAVEQQAQIDQLRLHQQRLQQVHGNCRNKLVDQCWYLVY